jgi:hypothetical protein
MITSRPNSRINRLVALAIALLVSNIAALSCAMAYSIGSDCEEPPPAHCVEMCDVAEAVNSDKSPDGTSDPRPPVANFGALLTSGQNFASANGKNAACNINFQHPSPPLNLLYCVFLK